MVATFQYMLGIIATIRRKDIILLIKDIKCTAQCSQRGAMCTINKDFKWVLVPVLDLGLHFG